MTKEDHETLVATAKALGADLSDDALIYSGAAQWEDWQNHVPLAVLERWKILGPTARAAVFLTAKAVTAYQHKEPA